MPDVNPAIVAPATTEGATQTTGDSASVAVVTSPPDTSGSDILRAANVPEEVVTALEGLGKEGQVSDDAAHTQEQPQGDESQQTVESNPEESSDGIHAETVGDQPADNQEPLAEENEPAEPEQGKEPNWYQKRLGKWTRQKDRLQDQIDELTEQLNGRKDKIEPAAEPQMGNGHQAPGTTARPNALGRVDSHQEIHQIVEAQRSVRDWCLQNPDGVVLNQGTPQEKIVSPEEVRNTLVGATRIIEDAPLRHQQLQDRVQQEATRKEWTELASKEWPDLFDKQSDVYKTSRQFLAQYPELNHNPNRDFLLGLMVEGWKPFQERMTARNGHGSNGTQAAPAPANNGQRKESLPEALKRKLPPIPKTIAPNPPRGGGGRSPRDDAAAAVERMAKEGGTMESAQAAIAAIEKANAASGDTKRQLSPV